MVSTGLKSVSASVFAGVVVRVSAAIAALVFVVLGFLVFFSS